ncbi:hypothetical protein SLA2020_317260 [Shorea laevis]
MGLSCGVEIDEWIRAFLLTGNGLGLLLRDVKLCIVTGKPIWLYLSFFFPREIRTHSRYHQLACHDQNSDEFRAANRSVNYTLTPEQ